MDFLIFLTFLTVGAILFLQLNEITQLKNVIKHKDEAYEVMRKAYNLLRKNTEKESQIIDH